MIFFIATLVCLSSVLDTVCSDSWFYAIGNHHRPRESIFYAAQHGDVQKVERLLQANKHVNIRNNEGFTPLYLAISGDHLPVVDLLMKNGADPNFRTSSNFTALFLAASKGNENIVNLLIENNADVNITNNEGWNALHVAAQEGYERIVDTLISHGTDVNSKMNKEWTPIFFAASRGHEKIVEILIREGADVNFKKSDGRTPLHTAVQEGFDQVVDVLIKNGANINAIMSNGWTPLFMAVQDDRKSIAETLIDNGADVNHKANGSWTAMHLAAQNGHIRIMKLLITNGGDYNSSIDIGWLPIHTSTINNRDQVIGLLYRVGADINAKTPYGHTPLHFAAHMGYEKIVVELLKLRADRKIKDNKGNLPIDVAMRRGFTNIVDLLKIPRPSENACKRYSQQVIDRIIGGEMAEMDEFPWMAALGYRSDANNLSFDCGCTIISELFVMTAAHCVRQKYSPILVRVGKLTLVEESDDNSSNYIIQEITRHPDYSFAKKRNDIALIRVASPIDKNIIPACLQTDARDELTDGKLVVTGWGSTSAHGIVRSNDLLKAQLLSMSLSECNETLLNYNIEADLPSLRNGVRESQYCAYDPQGKNDSCQGDSGGPLQYIPTNNTLIPTVVGIVSFGISCGTVLPSVYTRVAYYLDWIESIVWPNE